MAPITLSPEDRQKLLNLEDAIRQGEEELTRAEAAGLDMSAMRKKFEDAKRIRDGLLRMY